MYGKNAISQSLFLVSDPPACRFKNIETFFLQGTSLFSDSIWEAENIRDKELLFKFTFVGLKEYFPNRFQADLKLTLQLKLV